MNAIVRSMPNALEIYAIVFYEYVVGTVNDDNERVVGMNEQIFNYNFREESKVPFKLTTF